MNAIAERMRARARARKQAERVTGQRQPARPRPVEGDDTERILALDRYDVDDVPDLTEELRTPGGQYRLKPVQNLALWQLREAQGLVAQLAVGSGKTWIGLLAPTVLDARKALYLTPANTVVPVMDAYIDLQPHWRLVRPERLHVLSYAMLSRASEADLLEREDYDLLILDEAHYLRNPKAARTKRVMRAIAARPQTRVLAMSGTLTTKGVMDFAHHARWALRERSPLPLRSRELMAWSNVLDARGEPSNVDWSVFRRYARDVDTRSQAREVFQSRFSVTKGVAVTRESSAQCALYLRHQPVDVPHAVTAAVDEAQQAWCRPDGEEFESALDLWRYQKQLTQGFWYRWVWPNGVPDVPWVEARRNMARQVRRVLEMDLPGLDSPFLVKSALEAGDLHDRDLASAWAVWKTERHKPPPPTEVVWISDYLVRYAIDWLKRRENVCGLVWYDDKGMADALEAAGVTTYRAGQIPPLDGAGPMALSIRAHGTGLNLQRHHRNLLLAFPASGKTLEQLVGRTHRYGQDADDVTVDFVTPGPVAWRWIAKARSEARYISETAGSPQKILYGTWIVEDREARANHRAILDSERT